MGVFAARAETVADALTEAKDVFESHGLVLHELEICKGGAETLGVAVESRGFLQLRPRSGSESYDGGSGHFYPCHGALEMWLRFCSATVHMRRSRVVCS